LAGLSHDLRTPLTRLRLAIALLPTVTEAEQTQLSDHIQSLNALIDTALALSSSSESPVQQKQAKLSVLWLQWQKDYPDVLFMTDDSDCQVMLVSVLLTRIVQNLIDNALVHGLGEVRVYLSCQQVGWRIAVVDEGNGVPDQVWRAVQNQQQPKAKGVGIGLLTSYWLSQIMGVRLVRIPQGVGVYTI
jgi:two-component system osmolarity sensor histidine kinase EnvZ